MKYIYIQIFFRRAQKKKNKLNFSRLFYRISCFFLFQKKEKVKNKDCYKKKNFQ